MKEYNLILPDKLKKNSKEILEYLLSCHYEDDILTAGACSIILNTNKQFFKWKIFPKYENIVRKK